MERDACDRLRTSPEGDIALALMYGQLGNLRHRLRTIWGGVAESTMDQMALIIDDQPVPVAVLASLFRDEREAEYSIARLLATAGPDFDEDAGAAAATDSAAAEEEGYEDPRLQFFAMGSVAMGDRRSTKLEPGFDIDIQNLTVGVDYRLGDRSWVVGSLGYTSADADLKENGGEVDVEGRSLAVSGLFAPTDKTFVTAIALWGRADFEIAHNIKFDGKDQVLRSSPEGDLLALALDAGYALPASSFTAFVNTSYLEAEFGRYRESDLGGYEFELEVDEQRATSFVASVGLDFSRAISRRFGVLSPSASLEYLHEFEDDTRVISARFYASSAAKEFPLKVRTERPDRDYFRLQLGVSAEFGGGWAAGLRLVRDLERADIDIGLITADLRIPIR